MLECEQIDYLFATSEQKVTRGLIKKKMVTRNAYYGKIPDDQAWPLHSGTRIKGYRLGRIGVPDCTGWRPVEDELCSSNACSFEPDVISHGHSDYFFSLVQKDLRTDWICIDSLAFREMPEAEIAHLEDGIQSASRYVHEEFRRSRYLLFGRNKIIARVPIDDETSQPTESYRACSDSELVNNAYVFEVRPNGEMDECHVRVAVPPSAVNTISMLSLDMLDYASSRLMYEDEAYLDNTGLFDVLVADYRMSNQMALQEDEAMRNVVSIGGINLIDLRQTFGTERVLRNYSLRTDIHAMKFYPDTVVNAELSDETYDENDPNTWPRFFRVFPYKPQKAAIAGIEFVTNEAYLKAPFGISTIRSNRVMSVMSFPQYVGTGSARKMGGFGYEGTAQWQNPDWPCNVNRDKGFWKMRFRLAAKPDRDEEGYSYFHRIDYRIRLHGLPCALPATPCQDDVTPYCFEGMGGSVDTGLGPNLAIDD